MKNILILVLGASLIFSSCDKDDPTIPEETPTTVTTGDSFESDDKSVTINGKIYHAGFGFNLGLDKAYRVPIADTDMYESTNIDNSLSVDIQIIKNNRELNTFTSKGRSVSGKFSFKILSFGGSRGKTITEKFTVNSNHVTIIARIKSKRYKYLVDGTPTLTPAATELIEQGKVDDFIADYGSMYVSEHTLGGEVYYVYNYNIEKITKITKSEFAKKAKFGIGKIFGIGGGSSLTQEEKEIIDSAELKSGIVSTIIGYSPKIIQTIDDLNGEIEKIQNYLTTNPTLATTIDIEMKPYSDFLEDSKLATTFESEIQCFEDIEKWGAQKEKIEFIENSTKNPELKTLVENALDNIEVQIQNSSSCINAVTPAEDEFSTITTLWEDEQDGVPLYQYVFPGRYFYTANYDEFKEGEHGYTLDGIACLLFDKEKKGTIPLHRYYHSRHQYHFYTATAGLPGDSPTLFVYDGIAGYIYAKKGEGRAPLYRYEKLNQGYFYTTDYNIYEEGKDGYKLIGIEGYVLSYEE